MAGVCAGASMCVWVMDDARKSVVGGSVGHQRAQRDSPGRGAPKGRHRQNSRPPELPAACAHLGGHATLLGAMGGLGVCPVRSLARPGAFCAVGSQLSQRGASWRRTGSGGRVGREIGGGQAEAQDRVNIVERYRHVVSCHTSRVCGGLVAASSSGGRRQGRRRRTPSGFLELSDLEFDAKVDGR